jgi:hypothetical protein
MFAVPKPRRNGKPRPAITSFDPESCAGLAMDHGTGGSQKHYRSFLNKNFKDYFGLVFPMVGVTDHLIDGSWYGENTDQRGINVSSALKVSKD